MIEKKDVTKKKKNTHKKGTFIQKIKKKRKRWMLRF